MEPLKLPVFRICRDNTPGIALGHSPGDTDISTTNQRIIPSLWGEIRAHSSHQNPIVLSIARISLPISHSGPQKPQSFANSGFKRSLSSDSKF